MYVLSYFTLESENLHLAWSDDGRHFAPIDGGRPILASHVGSESIRDPFIGQTHDGVFHLLGTDGWRSSSIVHSSSTDLLEWTEPRLIPVMGDVRGTVNSWAPEFFTDPRTGVHHLIWSSIVDPSVEMPDDQWIDPETPQSIWTCSTADFVRFSPPRIFFDPGYTVIDATVREDGDGFFMAFKDERGWNALDSENKTIRFARFRTPDESPVVVGGTVPASPVEGPTLLRQSGEWVVLFDHFLEHVYGGAVSSDGLNWTAIDVDVPADARHASVFSPVPGSHKLPVATHATGSRTQSPLQG